MAKPDSQFEKNVEIMFKKADKDNNGYLTPLELFRVLKASGYGGTAEDCMSMFEACDVDKNKTLTLEELLHHLRLRDPRSIEETELRALFKEKFDKDGSGYITEKELQEVLAQCGRKGDARKYIECVDKDKDGKINFEEFLKLVKEDK